MYRRHRCPHEEPEHLTVEGDFYVPEKPQYHMAERPKPFKPTDNLFIEGNFEGKRKTKEDFKTIQVERSQIIRHEDNLKITDGHFYGETTSRMDYQREIEEDKPIRRNTYTKEEVENLNVETSEISTIRRRTWTKEDFEAQGYPQKQDESPTKYKPIERPQQIRPSDNLKPEGDFYSSQKEKYRPAERPKQV